MNLDNNEFLIENGTLLDYRSNKENVVIPEGVTKIAEDAFIYKRLTTIRFPRTLKTIASRAFCWAKIPNRLDFPESLESIECDAFNINKNQILYFNSAVQLHDINPNKYALKALLKL